VAARSLAAASRAVGTRTAAGALALPASAISADTATPPAAKLAASALQLVCVRARDCPWHSPTGQPRIVNGALCDIMAMAASLFSGASDTLRTALASVIT
jgi:hypothetical protein